MNVKIRKIMRGFVIFLFLIVVGFSVRILLEYLPDRSIAPYMEREKYYRKFDVSVFSNIEEVKTKKKSQLKVQSRDFRSNNTILQFNGYKMIFNECGVLVSLEIESPKYRFGKNQIGIGSSISVIENAYKGQEKITDTKPNEVGYIDGHIAYSEN